MPFATVAPFLINGRPYTEKWGKLIRAANIKPKRVAQASRQGEPLDYFELQAWKSFKTGVLSEEKLGLKWYYDPVTPGAARVEWDQT